MSKRKNQACWRHSVNAVDIEFLADHKSHTCFSFGVYQSNRPGRLSPEMSGRIARALLSCLECKWRRDETERTGRSRRKGEKKADCWAIGIGAEVRGVTEHACEKGLMLNGALVYRDLKKPRRHTCQIAFLMGIN